jgi:apolipoprotein N-acyltransferase
MGIPQKLWAKLSLCFLLGAVGAFSLPPFPIYTFPLLVLSLSGFWLLLTDFKKLWHAPLAGFLYGFGYFLAGIWWVGNALLVDGNAFLWALPFAVCGLQALLALFPMMAALISQWLYKGRSIGAYIFFLSMMGFWEWARGNFFTGFPWNLFGSAWTYSLPMLQILSTGGIYLLSLYTIFLCTVPAFALKGAAAKATRASLFVGALALGVGLYTYGHMRLSSHPTTYNQDVVIQVVSPNIPQADKWDGNKFWDNYIKTVNAISLPAQDISGKVRAIVLPETAFHYSAFEDLNAREKLKEALSVYPETTYLLTGLLRRDVLLDGSESYHNSLTGYDASMNEVMNFNKFHLVPFGEYMPLQEYIPIGPVIGFSGFNSGEGPETKILPNLPPFSPLVCYEVIFPGEVTALATDQQPRPEWLVNVTNDAWYAVSPGPYQHLSQTVFRAIEEGLPMIRATNTGFSAIIDPVGRILDQNSLFETSVQTSYLPVSVKETTLFAVYKNAPFLILLACLAFPLLIKVSSKSGRKSSI